MSESVVKAIGSLQDSLRRINEQQTKVMLDAMGPLSQLPEITETQTRQLLEAAYDSVRAQVLIAIAQQRGQLGAKESQINEELEEIERLRKAAEEQAEALNGKMYRRLEEISDNTNQLVNQLDKPVLDLGRRVFTENVFLPYTKQVVPHWRLQMGVGEGSSAVRKLSFEQSYHGVMSRVNQYLSEVDDLQNAAQDLNIDQDLPDDMSVPVCIVRYEEDGQISSELYIAPIKDDENEIRSSMDWILPLIKDRFVALKSQVLKQMKEIWQN